MDDDGTTAELEEAGRLLDAGVAEEESNAALLPAEDAPLPVELTTSCEEDWVGALLPLPLVAADNAPLLLLLLAPSEEADAEVPTAPLEDDAEDGQPWHAR